MENSFRKLIFASNLFSTLIDIDVQKEVYFHLQHAELVLSCGNSFRLRLLSKVGNENVVENCDNRLLATAKGSSKRKLPKNASEVQDEDH